MRIEIVKQHQRGARIRRQFTRWPCDSSNRVSSFEQSASLSTTKMRRAKDESGAAEEESFMGFEVCG
jgi:hypothetical protein